MSIEQRPPLEQELRELYRAAGAYYQLAPWVWMYDGDLFGVRNPETGEIGYCSVMGNLGEHFALGVYLGDEGLNGFSRIQNGEFEQSPVGALFVQTCLMASFEDREMLDKQDRAQIKMLGLKYRGRNAWPLFRDYTPGYFPWFLSGDQARFLTRALDIACAFAPRLRDQPELLDPPGPGQILVLNGPPERLEQHWHTPNLTLPPDPPAPLVDQARLTRIKQARPKRAGAWEGDCFYTPQPIQNSPGDRPFYPMVCMFVDSRSQMVLPLSLGGPTDWREVSQSQLLNVIEQIGLMPATLLVRSSEARALFAPITGPLGIKVRVTEQLPALDDAAASMLAYLSQQ